MDPSPIPPDRRWQRVIELFDTAVAMEESARESWLRVQCGDDESLRAEVQSLLDASRAEAEAVARFNVPEDVQGRRYGVWETIRLLGSGGMGSVLLAKRVEGEFEQTAALKLIAPHLVGPFFLDRFRTERQILANLNHPNITKLLDGAIGSDGAPFLVMEYVDGLPLNRHADENRLTITARLKLFLKICDAVEYAHRNLVVHRDLKPGNILVEATTGEPKLLDFGTARMMPPGGGADTTATTHRLVTPRYASPEALRHAALTTQADVFSLGVLLYEQVTGVWPFGNPTASPVEVADRITRAEITPPETAITEEAAQTRGCGVRELRGLARGDLATILRKATEADLARRYKSVADMASDLRAYLDGRPVMARRPTFAYRASKFVRRHWVGVASAVSVVAAVSWSAWYSVRQAEIAKLEADRSFDSWITLKQLIEAGGGSNAAPRTLEEVAAAAEKSVSEAPASSQPAILAAIARIGYQRGDLRGAEASARKAIEKARIVDDKFAEADALLTLAKFQSQMMKVPEAVDSAKRALTLTGKLGTFRRSQNISFGGNGVLAYAGLLGAVPAPETAKYFEEAIRLGHADPAFRRDLISLYALLAQFRAMQRDDAGQAEALARGLEIYREQKQPTLVEALILDQKRARLARDGDFAGARDFARERYELAVKISGPGAFDTLDPHLGFALELGRSGSWTEASAELAACRRQFDELSPEAKLVSCWKVPYYSAYVENRKPDPVLAERLAREAARAGIGVGWDPAKDARLGDAFLEVGTALRQQRKFNDAVAETGRALAIFEVAWGPEHRRTKSARNELARAKAADSGLPSTP